MDIFETEIKQLRKDFRDGAISQGAYMRAHKEILTRRDVASLEPNWWAKYDIMDAPVNWMNPHLESVWRQATPEKQDVALMAIGAFKEPNSRKKAAKYACLKKQLEVHDVYIGVTPEEFVRGGVKVNQIVAAAVMEVFTPSGLYSKR